MIPDQLVAAFPRPPVLGDWNYYIQRGATLKNYRPLGVLIQTALGTVAQAVNVLVAAPHPIGLACHMDEIVFDVSVAGGAGSVARVGLYRAISSRNIYPGARVVDGGEVVTTAGGRKSQAVSVNLKPGLYWAVYLCGVAAPTVRTFSTANNPILGTTSASPPLLNPRITVAQAYGALPATFPAGAAYDGSSMIGIWAGFDV